MTRTLFTDEHDQFRSTVKRFVANEVVPAFDKWEREGLIDRGLFAKAGELGFLGMAIPEQFGGGGVNDFRYNLIITEEIQAPASPALGSA